MIYLALMVIVAAIGMGTLWLHQRRQHAHGDTVEGFNEALRAISPEAAPGPFRRTRVPAGRPTRAGTRTRAGARRTRGRSAPLDPKRRAAARQRLEQRRRMEARRRAHATRTR